MTTVICRAPLRISLGGGGTDLPSYYQQFGSEFISAAISHYAYVTISQTIENGFVIRTPRYQVYSSIEDIAHKGIAEALKLTQSKSDSLEISSQADLPGQSGLGSSGSFYVALLKGLFALQGEKPSNMLLAEKAFELEAEQLKLPVGKQDQYIASLGDVRYFMIDKSGSVNSQNVLKESGSKQYWLEHLALFYTGKQRASAELLSQQDSQTRASDEAMIENLHQVKKMGQQSIMLLANNEVEQYGLLMHEHWLIKKQRSHQMSDHTINALYDFACSNGAIGGKLMGAGGGGFLLFVCHDKKKLINMMQSNGINHIDFSFDSQGVSQLK